MSEKRLARFASSDPRLSPWRRRFQLVKTPGATTTTWIGGPNTVTATGTAANADSSTVPMLRHTPASATAGQIGAIEVDGVTLIGWQPEMHARIRTAGTTTDTRVWVGLWDAAPPSGGGHVFAFRHDTGADGSNWVAYSSGGAGSTVTTTVPFANDTEYTFSLFARSATQLEYYVNGRYVTTHTTNTPNVGTFLDMGAMVVLLSTTSSSIRWSYLGLTY